MSPYIRAAFRELGVQHIDELLNIEHADYGFANKAYAAAFIESQTDNEIVVFLDSDKVVLQAPVGFLLREGSDVGVRPVETKNIGTDGGMDENKRYWVKLYRLLGCERQSFVTTTVDRVRIWSYYNGGMVVARRRLGLFAAYKNNLISTLRSGLCPSSGIFFVEQSVLAATIGALKLKVNLLPSGYNYPLFHQKNMLPQSRITSLEKALTLHYHSMFDRPQRVHPMDQLPSLTQSGAAYHWLKLELERCGVYVDPRHWPKRRR